MKRISGILIIGMFLFLPLTSKAQNSINLTILPGLNAIDFSAFTFVNDLSGIPRIFQVDITVSVPDKKVLIGGNVLWKKNGQSNFIPIVNNFITEPFTITGTRRIIFNDELGNSDIKLGPVDGNQDITDEIIKMGKPTGLYRINLFLYDEAKNQLGSTSQEIPFLNPAPTMFILTPQENSSFDVGNVQAIWTPVQGAAYYTIRANALQNMFQSAEEALNSGDPIINDRNVGLVESINLSSILDRQWVGGQRIALSVTAYITGPEGGSFLQSMPVTFKLNESGEGGSTEINPDLIRLGNFLSSRSGFSPEFADKLINGQIKIEQITDENGALINSSDFLTILSFWEANPPSVISTILLSK